MKATDEKDCWLSLPQLTQPSSWAGSPFLWLQWYSWEARVPSKLLAKGDPGVTFWCLYLHGIQRLIIEQNEASGSPYQDDGKPWWPHGPRLPSLSAGSSGNYILTSEEALGGAWEREQEKSIPRLTFVDLDSFIPQTFVGWAMGFSSISYFPTLNSQELICCSNLAILPVDESPWLQSILFIYIFIWTI